MTRAEPNLLAYASPPETVRHSRFRAAVLANLVVSYPAGVFVAAMLLAFGEARVGTALFLAAASPLVVPAGLLVLGVVTTVWQPGQPGVTYWVHLSIYAGGFAAAYAWFRRPRPVPPVSTKPPAAASV
jgi:hypothetical protein